MKLLYITNTRIPSKKANSYQSMQMADNFCNIVDDFEFIVANRYNDEFVDFKDDIYKFYNVKNRFKIIKLFCLDLPFLHNINQKLWFLTHSLTFAFSVLKYLFAKKDYIIFIRDENTFKILSLFKKYKIISNKIYFEAHRYSDNLIKYLKNINGLVVINNYLKELYQKQLDIKILVAHDGVNIDEYKNISDYKFDKNKKEYNIVYTGNLFKWKGVYTLVDSLEYLNDNVKLYIVGGSQDTFKEFKQYCENKSYKNRIILTGFIPKKETIKYIEIADILVLPNSANDKMSYYTSPLKLFEYMASKRPIVASRLPSLEEILTDRKNALLFEADNSKDLANKIKFAIQNDCENIVKQAYQDVEKYTWENRAKNIKRWIDEEI